MATAQAIESLDRFAGFDEVMLSGGDPLLMPLAQLRPVVHELRALSVKRLYVYTTFWNEVGKAILPDVDGFHFSIHDNPKATDLRMLRQVEAASLASSGKSFRLFFDESVLWPVRVNIQAWSRIERKRFMSEAELLELQPGGLPSGELLYIYLPTAGRATLKANALRVIPT